MLASVFRRRYKEIIHASQVDMEPLAKSVHKTTEGTNSKSAVNSSKSEESHMLDERIFKM